MHHFIPMKNTLKIVLLLIGFGFLGFSLYSLFNQEQVEPETRRQLYGMMGVGILFLLGGVAMRKR